MPVSYNDIEILYLIKNLLTAEIQDPDNHFTGVLLKYTTILIYLKLRDHENNKALSFALQLQSMIRTLFVLKFNIPTKWKWSFVNIWPSRKRHVCCKANSKTIRTENVFPISGLNVSFYCNSNNYYYIYIATSS